jgi:hypothetical protein
LVCARFSSQQPPVSPPFPPPPEMTWAQTKNIKIILEGDRHVVFIEKVIE